ncbi:L,D-transpeptidase [Actinomadura viridis]|uniref:Lipoprotein-anchoring transpeptidase ErfK/SrfK n=1 Tax=Actinomadura viridis TaxID=58110 RepID=A0A931DDG5_9ACTN|nr:Ig-like domain-containing protein [Actinomadura viridis]MBG6089054.1 lipoprotein-anchoring transpeptidase ErfK/SrfK [Actinomadura viridis]
MLLLTTACSGGDEGDGVTVGGKGEAGTPQVTVSPGDGDGKARPESGVTVTAAGGTIEQVALTRKGRPVEGALSADKTSWKSRTLRPGSQYQVTAVAKSPQGKTTTVTSRFTTLRAAAALSVVDVTPGPGEKVGVGMPIMVTFNRAVENRKAVEQALQIRSTKPATGAWYWVSPTQVTFRTKNGEYWQPNQQVTFTARLSGVRAGRRTYGLDDLTRRFAIGDSHIIVASTKTKRLVVRKNGVKIKSWPISAGKGGRVVNGVDTFLTTSGIHLTMGKENPAIMTSEWMGVDPKDKKNGGYKEVIPHAVRISNSGEYIHSMAATVWAQGRQNVSHGCLNSPPAAAQWFYDFAYRGDVVVITGSARRLDWNNGWSYYQMPWEQWVKGSALDRTVTTA